MNDSQSYDKQDLVEIDLRDLFLSVLLQWKKVFIIALLIALLASGYVTAKGLSAYYDRESAAEKSEEYQRLRNDYERNVAQMEKKINDIEAELVRQEMYGETSLILLINPYEVHTEKISYFIDTNYEIAPSQYYQNPDYTATIVNAYAAEIEGIDFDGIINSGSQTKLTSHNPVSGSGLKLVNTVTKPESGIIEITIYGDSDARVELMKKAIIEKLSAKKGDFDQLIGTHNLEVLSDTKKVLVNKDFVALRDTFNANFDTLSTNLEKAQQELDGLDVPVNNVPSRRNTAKKAIKYFVAGGILGAILGCCWIAWRLMFTGKLMSVDALEKKSNISILGVIAKSQPGRIKKWILEQQGIHAGMNADDMAEYVASNIRLKSNEKSRKIMLFGTVSEEDLELVKSMLSQELDGRIIEIAGDINKSSKAIKTLAEDADIICVEKLQKSNYADVSNEVRIINGTGKNIIGTVLMV